MNKTVKRVLLFTNFALVAGVSIVSMKFVEAGAKQIVRHEVASLCTALTDKINTDGWSISRANEFAVKRATFGGEKPFMRISKKTGDIWVETNMTVSSADPFAKNGVNAMKSINCSEQTRA